MALLADLEQQAQNYYSQDDMAKAIKVCQKILLEQPDHPKALDLLSTAAIEREDFVEAEQYLAVLVKTYPEDAVVEIKLGYAQEKQGKLAAALATYLSCYERYPENPVIFLYLGYVHILMGDEEKAAEIFSLGEDVDENMLKAHLNPQLGEILRKRSKIAGQTIHKVLTELHLATIRDMAGEDNLTRIYDAVWPQVDVRDFSYKDENQKPHLFYIPDLPAVPYFKRENMNWVADIEAVFDKVKQEVLNNMDLEGDGKPYLPPDMPMSGEHWDKIVGKMNWASVHLYKQGVANDEVIAKFSEVMKALKNVPLALIDGNPSEVFISVLKPETIIPPHFGVANNVLTVHFPLLVPEGCGLRVGQDKFLQREGEIIAFDDSYDHEAWNPSPDIRIVLIFEVWHPSLTEDEQKSVSATFEARKKWLEDRSIV